MTLEPDEDGDVIVRYCRQLGTDGTGRDTWTIWLGSEIQGELESLDAAVQLAREVADMYGRPAWLLDETGYPLKPIERERATLPRARPRPPHPG